MRQHQKLLLTVSAIVTSAALFGCAAPQPPPPTAVVLVPAQVIPAQATTAAIRSGMVVAVENTGASAGASTQGTSGAGSSGGTSTAGAASSEQLLTVQFDDGQRQQFQVAAGGLQFQVGERITVNTTQDTAVISR